MTEVFEAAPDGEPPRTLRDAAFAALHALGGDARIDAIREWVLANAAVVAPQGARQAQRRPVDRELLLALDALRREGRVESLPGARWALAAAPVAAGAPAPVDPGADGRLAELRAMAYAEYLKTPEWLRIRAAALERAGDCCRLNEGHREHLDVHHRSLERLGAELDDDLVVLCRSCRVLYRHAYAIVHGEEPGAEVPEPSRPRAIRPSRRVVPARLRFR